MANMTWTEIQPGWSWRSEDGRYVILRAVLPENRERPADTYSLRKIWPDMARAYPGNLGYLLAEHWSLSQAQAEAERDAYCDAHAAERDVPEVYQAEALTRFFWPVSQGTTRAALAIVRDGDRLVARVVGMAREEDPFVPVTYAEIDLTDVTAEREVAP